MFVGPVILHVKPSLLVVSTSPHFQKKWKNTETISFGIRCLIDFLPSNVPPYYAMAATTKHYCSCAAQNRTCCQDHRLAMFTTMKMNRQPVLNQATRSQNRETLPPSALTIKRCHPIARSIIGSKTLREQKYWRGCLAMTLAEKCEPQWHEKLNHWHGFLLNMVSHLRFLFFVCFFVLRLLVSVTVWCYMP